MCEWFYFEVMWSEVCYGEVLGDKGTMYIRVTIYGGYLIVLWLFHVVCILCYGCFNLFLSVGVLVICVLVFSVFCIVCTVFLYCFLYVYYLFCLY